jgi:hypothetical protein
MKISPEELREIISYDPETGTLTWKSRSFSSQKETKRWNERYAGKPALNHSSASGHLSGSISKQCIKAHRAAWAIYTGSWPTDEIDHINGNPADNRISNLRIATRTENARNLRKRKGGLSRFRGVSKEGKKWKAAINADGVRTYLGTFSSEETAAIAYDLFAPVMHGEFCRTNIIHDRDAMTAFVEDYVRRNFKTRDIDGVDRVVQKVAR